MAVVPDKIAEKLSYFEQHLPVWAANTTTIGITSLQISDLAILVADARANFDSAIDARSVSRAATVAQNASIPDGTTSANYYISAHRDEQTVNSAIMTLQFGSGGGAGLTLAA
jgi:hypothetical protein